MYAREGTFANDGKLLGGNYEKLSIRSLLIVILALVLVFSLVACGDKGNDNPTPNPTPTPTPTKDTTNVKNYFNTLWEQSTGIGNEAIAATDDLKVSLGLTVKLDFVDSKDGSVQDSVDVGILLDLVLDRSSGKDKSTNTAIKAKIYDPSASENWFTAYYFFNDVDNIYIDYAGQNVKIPFSYFNNTYNKSFYNFIYNDKIVKGKSIAEVVTALTANMGKTWDLNTLVGDVMRVFGIKVDDLKDSIGGVFEMLGLSVDEAFDAQGNINIKNVLTNETVAGFFVNDVTGSTTKDGVTTYTTQLDPEVLGLLDMLGSSLPAGLTDLLDGVELFLEFTTKNNAIDTFTIRAGLPSLECENAAGKDVYPVVAITITDLNFAKATKGEIEKSMAVERTQYTDQVVLDAAVAIDLKGITLDATKFDKYGYNRFSKVNTAIGGGLENIKLDGTLALTLNGKLDLKDAESNKTEAAAALTYKAADAESAVDIVKASFKGGNLALTVNQEAKVGNVKIVDALVRLFGDYAYTWIRDTFFKDAPENANEEEKEKAAASRAELDKFAAKFFSCNLTEELAKDPQERVITINPDFKGAAWKNFDIVGGFQGLVKKALDKMFPPKTDNNGASAQYANDPIITKVSETIVRALPLLSTKGDKLTVKTNTGDAFNKNYGTVGAAVNYLGQTWWVKKAKPFTESIMTSDNDNWLGHISKALTVAGCEYNDIAAAPLVTDAELAAAKEKRADKGLVTDKELAAAKALEANAGKADDVLKAELQAEKDLSIRKALQKAKDEARSKAFINEIFKATAEVVLNISGTDGLELSVKADVNASAGVGVSVKLGAKAYNAADYTDLAPAGETDGWYVLTITKKA